MHLVTRKYVFNPGKINAVFTGNIDNNPVTNTTIIGDIVGYVTRINARKNLQDKVPSESIIDQYSNDDLKKCIEMAWELRSRHYNGVKSIITNNIQNSNCPLFDPDGEHQIRFTKNVYDLFHSPIPLIFLIGCYLVTNIGGNFEKYINCSKDRGEYLKFILSLLQKRNLLGYILYEDSILLNERHIVIIDNDIASNNYYSFMRHLAATYNPSINTKLYKFHESHIDMHTHVNNISTANSKKLLDYPNLFFGVKKTDYIMPSTD